MQILFVFYSSFFFQAEDGIRDTSVTGVQTCALPIWSARRLRAARRGRRPDPQRVERDAADRRLPARRRGRERASRDAEIGRASCRERAWIPVVPVSARKKCSSRCKTTSVIAHSPTHG